MLFLLQMSTVRNPYNVQYLDVYKYFHIFATSLLYSCLVVVVVPAPTICGKKLWNLLVINSLRLVSPYRVRLVHRKWRLFHFWQQQQWFVWNKYRRMSRPPTHNQKIQRLYSIANTVSLTNDLGETQCNTMAAMSTIINSNTCETWIKSWPF